MSTRMRDLLARRSPAAPRADREARAGELGDETASTARARCWCGSRAASCPPTPCRRPTSAPRSRPRRGEARSRRRPAPGHRVRRPHRRGRAGHDRRSRRRRVPARRARRLRRARLLRLRRLVRGGRADPGHPRDPYSRVDVRRTARPVRIEARRRGRWPRHRARLLYETQIPTRFYLPARGRAGRRSSRATGAPIARTRARRRTGPSRPAGRAREPRLELRGPAPGRRADHRLVAFWDERVDVYVDGELRPRPGGAVADGDAGRVRLLARKLR